ncbi:uncharacterized protein ACNLHF_013636 isoform 1-T3 [Anomaloglossus baeobatrachus]
MTRIHVEEVVVDLRTRGLRRIIELAKVTSKRKTENKSFSNGNTSIIQDDHCSQSIILALVRIDKLYLAKRLMKYSVIPWIIEHNILEIPSDAAYYAPTATHNGHSSTIMAGDTSRSKLRCGRPLIRLITRPSSIEGDCRPALFLIFPINEIQKSHPPSKYIVCTLEAIERIVS